MFTTCTDEINKDTHSLEYKETQRIAMISAPFVVIEVLVDVWAGDSLAFSREDFVANTWAELTIGLLSGE